MQDRTQGTASAARDEEFPTRDIDSAGKEEIKMKLNMTGNSRMPCNEPRAASRRDAARHPFALCPRYGPMALERPIS